jgi:hypothetical protein
VGNLRVQDISKLFEEDQLEAFFNQRLLHLSEEILGEKDQVIWIVDLEGKIMQLASKKILDALAKIISNLQTYFPELLYRYLLPEQGWSLSTRPSSSTPSGQNSLPTSTLTPRKKSSCSETNSKTSTNSHSLPSFPIS